MNVAGYIQFARYVLESRFTSGFDGTANFYRRRCRRRASGGFSDGDGSFFFGDTSDEVSALSKNAKKCYLKILDASRMSIPSKAYENGAPKTEDARRAKSTR